jgi:hypothetical protein
MPCINSRCGAAGFEAAIYCDPDQPLGLDGCPTDQRCHRRSRTCQAPNYCWDDADCLPDTSEFDYKCENYECQAYPISPPAPPAPPRAAPYVYEITPPELEIPLPTLVGLTKFLSARLEGAAPDRYLIIPWIGEYIAAAYKYAVGITGILAAIMIVVAGLIWLTAGGSAERISTSKSFIENALVGLMIALTSYLLLYAINPKLTEFEALKVKFIERIPLEEDWSPPSRAIINESTAYTGEIPALGANNIPYFAQFRGDWANKCCGPNPEGPCESEWTLKASGCRVTSYAMILKYYFPDQNIDPGTVSFLGGARCNVSETQLSNSPWGQIVIKSININEAKELLDQGKPIVILCRPCVGLNSSGSSAHKYRGHYMVLTGYQGDTFSVNDPGANPNTRISSMTVEMMKNPCNFVSSSDDTRVQDRCQSPVSNPSLYYLHPAGR